METPEKIAKATNHLAVNLLTVLARNKGNVFISPFSIANALAMVCCGTGAETFQEMVEVLGFEDLSDKDIAASFNVLLSSLEKTDDKYTLEYANSSVMQETFPVKEEYKKVLEDSFRASLFLENFANEPQLAVDRINEWVTTKTHGMIEHLLDDLDPSTVMVLLNAVYFKGTWLHQFKKESTCLQKFFNNGDEQNPKDVEMMHLKENFFYVEKETFKALQLPYLGEDIAMLVLLPHSFQGLEELEGQLVPSFVEDLGKEMRRRKIKVSLPKFRIEYSKSLKETFQDLGMRKVFETNADLSGISDCKSLNVTEILHKAVIEVNEEGSEAAAVTAAMVMCRMLVIEPEFTVDHPFLFVIYNTKSNVNLFTGRVVEF